MMRPALLLSLSIAGCVSVAGCGTMFTRGNDAVFGAYPFEAAAFDLVLISKAFEGGQEAMGMIANGRLFLLWGLVSLPFDVAIDVLACPIDVVAWIMGTNKDQEASGAAEAPAKRPGTLYEQEMQDLYDKLKAEKAQRDKARQSTGAPSGDGR